jgi:excisionase family DNA binding protein
MTLDEVADYFRVSRRTVENWVREGVIRAIRVGGIVRVRRDELEIAVTEVVTK